MHKIIFLVSIFSLISCAKSKNDSLSKLTQGAIINGTVVKTTDSLITSAVAVYNVKEKYLCTGTLISNNTILTAAHCLSSNPAQLKVIFHSNIDYVLENKDRTISQTLMLPVVDMVASSTWNPASVENSQSEPINTGDIAILKFSGKYPANYVPATFLNDMSLIKIGTQLTLVGYGVDTVDYLEVNPKKVKNLEKYIEEGSINCQDDKNGKHLTCFQIDMSGDGILQTTETTVNLLFESEFQLNENKTGTCNGDSGGPAYLKKDGKLYLVGVTSRGSALCNEVGVYTNALFYKKWIDETVLKFK